MGTTIDANVLIYATNTSDPAQVAAAELVGRLAAGPELVTLFWPVLMAYLRISTHRAILPQPLSAVSAEANLAGLIGRPNVRVCGEADGFWTTYADETGPRPAGNDVPDAHLVALMRQHGVGTIYTRDRGFRRFDGIRVVDPFAG